jgi:hypothetical protein
MHDAEDRGGVLPGAAAVDQQECLQGVPIEAFTGEQGQSGPALDGGEPEDLPTIEAQQEARPATAAQPAGSCTGRRARPRTSNAQASAGFPKAMRRPGTELAPLITVTPAAASVFKALMPDTKVLGSASSKSCMRSALQSLADEVVAADDEHAQRFHGGYSFCRATKGDSRFST